MQIAPHRLLGFAFASADLLLELDAGGKIAFAVGAAAVVAGASERSLVGRKLADYLEPADAELVRALLASADGAARRGPVTARLAHDPAGPARAFAISVCKLPQNGGAISCGLSRAAPPLVGEAEGGLHERHSFESVARTLFETARATGQPLELSFVETDGFAEAIERLSDEARETLQLRLAGALRAQSQGGAAAARLEPDRYALVRGAGEAPEALAERLKKLMALGAELGEVKLGARSMPLEGEASPSQIVRALRYALDDFVEGGLGAVAPASLQDAVSQSVRHTIRKANALGSAVAERRFELAYQPVMSLADNAVHHYEALLRFGDDQSPFPMVRMAEELDLIEALDLAVAERAADALANDARLKLAVNVSGRTITSPGFIANMARLVEMRPAIEGRLLFEVTESVAIDDLPLADRHIQALRRLSCQVCLDDFGAGAASLAYLQQLSVDMVKIDGRYIRRLGQGGREATFIRHLVHMCHELKVLTVAEMVEDALAEQAVRQAGVDLAQGYLYGAPAERPAPPATRGPAARRVGAA